MTNRKHRRGWTLLDVLVSFGCIVILLALVAPAISQARSAARRAACKNNLKQIALALHNYHDVYFTFPPSWTSHNWLPGPTFGYGWQTGLLPYVEYNQVYEQIGWRRPLPPANRLFQTPIPVYRCPEDATPNPNPLRDNYGTSNYSGNYGTRRGGTSGEPLTHWLSPRRARYWPGLETPVPRQTDGIFYHNSKVGIRDITDGTSNTILVGERSVKSGAGVWPGIRSADLVNDLVTDCSPGNELNSRYTSFSSEHKDGANFALCDGRVVFISNSISPDIYSAVASRNGGEVVGEF